MLITSTLRIKQHKPQSLHFLLFPTEITRLEDKPEHVQVVGCKALQCFGPTEEDTPKKIKWMWSKYGAKMTEMK